MAEVNETKNGEKPKKTVWLIVAGAKLRHVARGARALSCPGVSLLRTRLPGVRPRAAARTGSNGRTDAGGHCRAGVRRGHMRCENGLFCGAGYADRRRGRVDAVQRAAGITLAVDDASLPLTEVSLAAGCLTALFPTDAIENAMTAIGDARRRDCYARRGRGIF